MANAPGPPFAARLLAWYRAERRDLPWRQTTDPWAIWVSEVMLQQTRVAVVREPFARFLRQFPTPAAFAKASDDELQLAWRGLGYYRRARLLRDGARAVVQQHRGQVPTQPEQLSALPGIGAYTLGAVASIAFGQALPAIDGNVERVFARHAGITAPIHQAAAKRELRERVAAALDRQHPGDFNQAVMELGAMLCTPRSPQCERCPVRSDCVARQTNRTAELPVRKSPRAMLAVTARVALMLRGGEALAARIPAGEANAGQLELPGPGLLTDCPTAADLQTALRARFRAQLTVGPVAATIAHTITHHRITAMAHHATLQRRGDLDWWPISAQTTWTTASRKLFAAFGLAEA